MKNFLTVLLFWNIVTFIFPNFVQAQIIGYTKRYDGVYVEKFANDDIMYQCSDDNVIYSIGRTYTFQFQYKDPHGKELSFDHIKGKDDWQYIPSHSDTAAYRYSMSVISKKNADEKYIREKETGVQIAYYSQKYRLPIIEYRGIIENQKNIWIWTPQNYIFKILILNPFPYIQYPCKVGRRWDNKLSISDLYQDARWATWNGVLECKSTYKITDISYILVTKLGELKCCKVESKAKSKLGTTYLTYYFNEIYGFVRLEYTNIDQSTMIIDLIECDM
jgi:hypothetical protein